MFVVAHCAYYTYFAHSYINGYGIIYKIYSRSREFDGDAHIGIHTHSRSSSLSLSLSLASLENASTKNPQEMHLDRTKKLANIADVVK